MTGGGNKGLMGGVAEAAVGGGAEGKEKARKRNDKVRKDHCRGSIR